MSQGGWQREQMGAGCRQQPQPGRNAACVNNCGFFGNETTLNMCPKCYRNYLLAQSGAGTQSSTADSATSLLSAEKSVHTCGNPVGPGHDAEASLVQGSIDRQEAMISVEHLLVEEISTSGGDGCSLINHSSTLHSSMSPVSKHNCFPRDWLVSDSAALEAENWVTDGDYSAHDASAVNTFTGSEVELAPDRLVRSHASRSLDVDLRKNPVLLPAGPSPLPSAPQKPVSVSVTAAKPLSDCKVNRCAVCRKKVGLTGFKCRCNGLFCGNHRYSDKHSCSFDYKAAGREAIAKANPIVKADKITRF